MVRSSSPTSILPTQSALGRRFLWAVAAIVLYSTGCNPLFGIEPETSSKDPLVRSGERVVLIGGGWVERMQEHSWFDLLLTANVPSVTIRNIGWGGDTVYGDSRAVFGARPDGYARLLRDIEYAAPQVAIVCYGENEAYDGEKGLVDFIAAYRKLIADIQSKSARLILVIPRAHESVGPGYPNPSRFNAQFAKFAKAIRTIADETKSGLIDLETFSLEQRFTNDGVMWNENGYRATAFELTRQLGLQSSPSTIRINTSKKQLELVNARSGEAKAITGEWRKNDVRINTSQLGPAFFHPAGFNVETTDQQGKKTSRVVEADKAAIDSLRSAIARKNEWFFHRYRPQNETYLFLFRKHEQGNNAVEVDQMDKLVADSEAAIAKQITSPEPQWLTIPIGDSK